jgi:hypothetical protein
MLNFQFITYIQVQDSTRPHQLVVENVSITKPVELRYMRGRYTLYELVVPFSRQNLDGSIKANVSTRHAHIETHTHTSLDFNSKARECGIPTLVKLICLLSVVDLCVKIPVNAESANKVSLSFPGGFCHSTRGETSTMPSAKVHPKTDPDSCLAD